MSAQDCRREPLRVLLVGGGGREHALAWKLSQSPLVEEIFVVPGNGGTAAGLAKVSNVVATPTDDYPGLVDLARSLRVNLVVPGPEGPLVDGIEGYFRAANIACFGPSKEAARLEGSKVFSKDFMLRYNVPTAKYCSFGDHDSAQKYVNTTSHPIVIKASGLAAGKGVIIPQSNDEALVALREIMLDRKFGDAGKDVVVEEFLEGDELSILTFSDGMTFKSMPPAQDHKRIYDGDKGPNTGGMGCYAPAKIPSPSMLDDIDRTILEPTFDGMRKEGIPFTGMLFTGLMITKSGPKVLEYNARFGDPETQTLLPLLSSRTDLAEIMTACVEHRLEEVSIEVEPKACVAVVAASGGYPGSYRQGDEIRIDPLSD
ncbi:MAG: Bifunctional purine biosynthetic protein ade1, partial [Geoglossum umbratile]